MSESNAPAPLVSVIIPVYNAEKYLRETLDCVCNQTLRNIEIICVDDGSTDGSLSILEEYAARDGRFRILQQKNQYAGVARNNGMAIAKGKYLSFLDADDLFLPDMLEKMSARAEATGADMVYCDADDFDDMDKERQLRPFIRIEEKLGKRADECFCPREELGENMFQQFYVSPWNKLYLASYVRESNNSWQPTPYCNDVAFVIYSLYKSGRMAFVKEPLVKYRVRRSSISHHSSRDVRVFANAWGLAKSRIQEDGASTPLINSLLNVVLRDSAWFIGTLAPAQREQLQKMGREGAEDIFAYMLEQGESIYEYHEHFACVKSFFRPFISFAITDTPAWCVERKLESLAGMPFYDYEILYAANTGDAGLMQLLAAQVHKNPRLRIVPCPAGGDAAAACRGAARGRAFMHLPGNLKLRAGIAPALRRLAESAVQGEIDAAPYGTRQAHRELFYRSRSDRRNWCLFGIPLFTIFYPPGGRQKYFLLGRCVGEGASSST